MRIVFVATLLLFCVVSGRTQVLDETYFADSTLGNLDHILSHLEVEDGIIVTGKMFDGMGELPVILKIDSNGEIIWTSLETTQLFMTLCNSFNIMLSDDGFIYGSSSGNGIKYLWKVNATDGNVVWVNDFYSPFINGGISIADYDVNRFALATKVSNFVYTICLMDKNTGDTLETKSHTGTIGNYSSQVNVDGNGNIYFFAGFDLIKFNKDDFSQKIWQRDFWNVYPQIQEIDRFYIDKYDQLFVFAVRMSGFLDSRVYKVDSQSGSIIWQNYISPGIDCAVADIEDRDNKIVVAYRHVYVGGGTYFAWTAKFDKTTGIVDWFSSDDFDSGFLGMDGWEQANLSIDLDCNGDVYTTGYFGDVNYGPDEWGILKLDGTNGNKIYDTHIDFNTSTDDDLSKGLATCLFGNTPVFLGHREEGSGNYEPVLVKIDPISGLPVYENYIASEYLFNSKTIDIQNHNDSMYVFKQVGDYLQIELHAPDGNLIWYETFSDTSLILGGNFKISGSHVYFTSRLPVQDVVPPYYNNNSNNIRITKLNRFTGVTIDSDQMLFPAIESFPIELEVSNDTAFVFYKKNSDLVFRRWASSSFSSEQYIETAGTNCSYSGQLDIAFSHGTNKILFHKKNGLFQINKATLVETIVIPYSNFDIYDSYVWNDTLYSIGNNNLLEQVVFCSDLSSASNIWQQPFFPNGTFYKIERTGNMELIVAGAKDSIINILNLNSTNGNLNWIKWEDSIMYPKTIPITMTFNPQDDYLFVGGYIYHSQNHTDGLATLVEFSPSNTYKHLLEDDFNDVSVFCASALRSDSTLWVGGAVNQVAKYKNGFIFQMDYGSSETLQIETACDSFISAGMNVYTSSGIYSDTLVNYLSCDSIITLDLTINNSSLINVDTSATDSLILPNGITVYSSGIYSDTLSTSGGCDSIYIYTVVMNFSGINEQKDKSAIYVFPNPAKDFFLIKTIENGGHYIVLRDLTGRNVYENYFLDELLVPVDDLESGIYMIEILYVDAKKSTHLLVVESD